MRTTRTTRLRRSSSVKLYEYQTWGYRTCDQDLATTLAQFGAGGWELVCILPSGVYHELIFKRPAVKGG